MSVVTDYLENKLIDHIFRNRAFAVPAGLYVALFTAAPDDTGGGTEVAGGSYARVQAGPSDAAWKSTQGTTTAVASSGTGGSTTNGAVITFPAPTADWGHITHFAILDAISGGNMLIYGPLTTAKTINNGDAAPSFAIGALVASID